MSIASSIKESRLSHIVLCTNFLLSGLIVNLLQLLTCLIWPLNKTLFRKIQCQLTYMSWSQMVFLAERWSGTTCRLCGDENVLQNVTSIGHEDAIVIMNHSYDIDWLMGWMMCDRYRILGASKAIVKKKLRYIPVIGWTWCCTESIFVERNIDHDRTVISKQTKNLHDYPLKFWMQLYCEGTRFTKEKHEQSLSYARQRNLPELKHLLLPRTKGFYLSVQGLKDKVAAIYDCTVAFPTHGNPPTVSTLLNGKPCHGEIYFRRIPISQVPTDSEEECAKWLNNLYVEKDEILEKFKQVGKFEGENVAPPIQPHCLWNMIFWAALIIPPTVYGCLQVLLCGSLTLKIIIASIFIAVYVTLKMLITVTDTTKSSAYGSKSTTAKPKVD